MKRYTLIIVLLCCIVLFTGCTNTVEYQRQIADLQNQIIELQRTTASLAIRLEEMNNSMIVIQEAVEANRNDLDEMREEFERPQVIFGKPENSSPAGFVDPNKPRGLAGMPGANGNGAAPADQGVASNGESAAGDQAADGNRNDLAMIVTPALDIAEGGEDGLKKDPDADEAFQKATGLYKQEDYGLAIFEFNSLIRQYPESDRVPRAQYMLGECYFALKDWSQALVEYKKVLDAGYNSQIQDSLYKTGLCYEYLGNSARARSSYEKLLERYPNSQQARAAETRLKGLP